MWIRQVAFCVGFLFCLVLGVVFTAAFLFFQDNEPERTCKSVQLEQKAFKTCLASRPACEALSVESFIKYYENKDWISANCSESGDGYQS